jgi:hypothetical protein
LLLETRILAKSDSTLHHFIALFSTVAGKLKRARWGVVDFRNEIKDLEPIPKANAP